MTPSRKFNGHPAQWRRVARRAVLGCVPRRLLMANGPPGRRTVFLTFDDGPHPEHTPRLLDLLRRNDALATFFVTGDHVEQYPEIVSRIAREGHALGNHTFHHQRITEIPVGQLIHEVRRTAELVFAVTGRRPRLFRPPYGRLAPLAVFRLWTAGQTVVLWNSDPRDFALKDAESLAGWFRSHPLEAGDITLLHDNVPHAADVLPQLIEDTRRRGLDFAIVEHVSSANSWQRSG